MASIKAELASAVYSLLEALTIFRDHDGLMSPIGPTRARQFNTLLLQAQQALPDMAPVHHLESLMEYEPIVSLITRLTVLKSIVDRTSIERWSDPDRNE